MADTRRSREALEAEVLELRARVEELERDLRRASALIGSESVRGQRALMDQVPAILWSTDTDLRLTWSSGGAMPAVMGAVPLGTSTYEYFGVEPGNENEGIAAHLRALQGETVTCELLVGDKTFTSHLAPELDADGTIVGVIGASLDITERLQAERELREALERVRTLSGLIPICMHCKNVRNDGGYWEQVETYVHAHSLAEFTHAICPDCMSDRLADAEAEKAS